MLSNVCGAKCRSIFDEIIDKFEEATSDVTIILVYDRPAETLERGGLAKICFHQTFYLPFEVI